MSKDEAPWWKTPAAKIAFTVAVSGGAFGVFDTFGPKIFFSDSSSVNSHDSLPPSQVKPSMTSGNSPFSTTPSADFTSPMDGTGVHYCYAASGVAKNIPSAKVIWLVEITPASATVPAQGYVADVIHIRSGSWTSRRHSIGDPGDEHSYTLELLMMDASIAPASPSEVTSSEALNLGTVLNKIVVERLHIASGESC